MDTRDGLDVLPVGQGHEGLIQGRSGGGFHVSSRRLILVIHAGPGADTGRGRKPNWIVGDPLHHLAFIERTVEPKEMVKAQHPDTPPEALQHFVLGSIAMGLAVGLFGQTLSELLDEPPNRVREVAAAFLRAQRPPKSRG